MYNFFKQFFFKKKIRERTCPIPNLFFYFEKHEEQNTRRTNTSKNIKTMFYVLLKTIMKINFRNKKQVNFKGLFGSYFFKMFLKKKNIFSVL